MVLLPLSDSVQRAGEMEPQCGCGLGFWSQSAKVICFNIACPQNHSTVLEISPCHLKKTYRAHCNQYNSFNPNPDIKHACELGNKSYFMPVRFFNGRQDVSVLLVMTFDFCTH